MAGLDVIVFSHGIFGRGEDSNRIREAFEAFYPRPFVFLQPDANAGSTFFTRFILNPTLDGVDAGALRLAGWMEERLAPLLPCRLSVIGHSLGGVYLRAALKLLADRGFLDTGLVHLENFITFATPHLGIRETSTWWVPLVGVAPVGRDLVGDSDVLLGLTDAAHLAVLGRFRKRVLYGNVAHDSAVQYHTSLLTLVLPQDRSPEGSPHVLSRIEGPGELDQKQVGVIFHRASEVDVLNTSVACQLDCPEHTMLCRLASLDWQRYPVQFPGTEETHCFIIAHPEKDPDARGWDVLRHMVLTHFCETDAGRPSSTPGPQLR
eukprot:EG_transcript_11269